jgi:hypothetical protein
MNAQNFLKAIEADEASRISFLQRFVQAPSPNPPGDTREAANVIVKFLESHGITPEIIAPQAHMPNIVSDFTCGIAAGPRLAMVSIKYHIVFDLFLHSRICRIGLMLIILAPEWPHRCLPCR